MYKVRGQSSFPYVLILSTSRSRPLFTKPKYIRLASSSEATSNTFAVTYPISGPYLAFRQKFSVNNQYLILHNFIRIAALRKLQYIPIILETTISPKRQLPCYIVTLGLSKSGNNDNDMVSYISKSTSSHLEYYEQGVDGWLVSLFNGISTLFRLFNAKAVLQEE